MSKYIDADLLRAEIERRLSWRITLEARAAYNNILRFLDTLPEQPVKGLEEEIEKIAYDLPTSDCMHDSEWTDAVEWVKEKFRHFAEWMKAKMMEDVVEGEICGRVYDHINVRFADGVCKYLEPKNISHIPANVSKFKVGDKVRVIVIKEDKK